MRGLSTLIILQALLSTISGVLMANMSLIGRLGVWFLYRDYGVLRIWWKTALILWAAQLLLILILWLGRRMLPRWGGRMLAGIFLMASLAGAYVTYLDFTETSHRLLRADFHRGGYLVWVAAGVTCLWFLFERRKRVGVNTPVDHHDGELIDDPDHGKRKLP